MIVSTANTNDSENSHKVEFRHCGGLILFALGLPFSATLLPRQLRLK